MVHGYALSALAQFVRLLDWLNPQEFDLAIDDLSLSSTQNRSCILDALVNLNLDIPPELPIHEDYDNSQYNTRNSCYYQTDKFIKYFNSDLTENFSLMHLNY